MLEGDIYIMYTRFWKRVLLLAELSFCLGDVATCLFDQFIYCTSINYGPDLLVLTFNPTLNRTESHSVCFDPIKLCKIVVISHVGRFLLQPNPDAGKFTYMTTGPFLGFPWCGQYCNAMVRIWGKIWATPFRNPKLRHWAARSSA